MSSFATSQVIHSFMLREKRKAFVCGTQAGHVDHSLVTAVMVDLGQLGFTFDGELMKALGALDLQGLKAFHVRTLEVAREAVGAHVKYRPLYRDFPHDVPDWADHFVRSWFGHLENVFGPFGGVYTPLSCGHIVNHRLFDLEKFGACPICHRQVMELDGEQRDVVPMDEITPLKMLGLAKDDDVWTAFVNVLRSRTSISESYKGFVRAVVSLAPQEAARRLPAEMPFKENAAFVVAALLRAGIDGEGLRGFVKTPTDVLRVAVALCDGDVSLAEKTTFKIASGHRQFLMRAFNELAQKPQHILEEMLGYRGRWLRLGEVLHVGQFKRRYPKAAACFDTLRNNEASIQTHAARVEHLMVYGSMVHEGVRAELLATLAQRPGEFARKLDALLRRMPEAEVLKVFNSVASGVSTPVLLTLMAHFRNRAVRSEFRAFMPKGSVAKMWVSQGDSRAPLSMAARLGVMELAEVELRRRFAERGALGKVYVDEKLEGVIVPFAQRSASTGMSPMTRGSRIPVDMSKGFVRLFMHWKESESVSYVDVDLTCGLYDEYWHMMSHLSWTNTSSYGRSAHSGDLRSGDGPDGACEFIDLDLRALERAGVRYAAVTVYSYSGQKFSEFPCFAGFMERDEPKRGKYFEPRSVKHKFDISGEQKIHVPMVLDLKTGEVVWADMSLKSQGRTVESVGDRTIEQFKAVMAMKQQRLSLKDLFELHGRARGQLVESAEEADVVFDESRVNALDDIVANWL